MSEKITKTILNKEVQAIQSQLTAPNLGTDKQFININGSNLIFESNTNSTLNYKLPNPIKLDVGDKVTLYQAFVNESGLNQDTITFQEDVYEELSFLYYVPSQGFYGLGTNASTSNGAVFNPDGGAKMRIFNTDYSEIHAHPSVFTTTQDQFYTGHQGSNALVQLPTWNTVFNSLAFAREFNSLYTPEPLDNDTNIFGGDNGQPFYLMESYTTRSEYPERTAQVTPETSNRNYIKPAYGTSNVLIPAGNYDLDALARLVTEQINGAKLKNQNSNYLSDRLYNPTSANYANSDTNDVFGDPQNSLITKVFTTSSLKNGDYVTGDPDPYAWDMNYLNITKGSDETDERLPIFAMGDLAVSPDTFEAWIRCSSNTVQQDANADPIETYDVVKCLLPIIGDSYTSNRAFYTYWMDNLLHIPDIEPDLGEGNPEQAAIANLSSFNNRSLYWIRPEKEVANKIKTGAGGISPGFSLNTDKYVGTHSFELSYGKNRATRFSLNNLHEPTKISSINPDGTVNNFSGQQATKYNIPSDDFLLTKYPIEASSGIMVTNFCGGSVKNTDMYKKLKKELDDIPDKSSRKFLLKEYELKTKKFHEFFENERDARNAYKNTLWARLGFEYNQLGDISNNIDTINTLNQRKMTDANGGYKKYIDLMKRDKYPPMGIHKLKGLITHNAFDFSDIQSCANMGSLPLEEKGNIINMYSQRSFAKMSNVVTKVSMTNSLASNGKSKQSNGVATVTFGNNFSVLCDSQSFDASGLPNLNNGNSYYLIHSNVVKPNGLDSNSETMNLLGVMSKQNSSNDTIYSVDGVPNINTEEKVLTKLEIQIKNPDGSVVPDSVIGKNSGFVLMIEKAIKPGLVNMAQV